MLYITVCVGLALTCSAAYTMPQYTISDLGSVSGLSVSEGYMVTEENEVFGIAYTTTSSLSVFKWSESTGMENLTSGFYRIDSVNNFSTTGWSGGRYHDGSHYGAMTVSPDGTVTSVGYNQGASVWGISDDGLSVGFKNGIPRYWPTSIVLNYTGSQGVGIDIIDENHIIGTTYSSWYVNNSPVYWTSPSATMSTFALLDGIANAAPTDMNGLYQTVGWSADASGLLHAVIWDSFEADPLDLGYGQAEYINEAGTIIFGIDGDDNPVYWIKQNGSWSNSIAADTLLEDPMTWTITQLGAINSSGYIAATGTDGTSTRALLLTPDGAFGATVPEPATLILSLLGSIALALKKKRA